MSIDKLKAEKEALELQVKALKEAIDLTRKDTRLSHSLKTPCQKELRERWGTINKAYNSTMEDFLLEEQK